MREADANPLFLQDAPLHRLIGSFYDAASGQRKWTAVCDELCEAFDLWAVQILGIYKNNGALIFSFEGGRIAPEVWLEYITRYHAINPRMAAAALLQGEDWAHDHELLDEKFVAGDPFYQELLIPYGARWISGTKLIEDDEFVVFLGLHRGVDSTPLTPADIERFAPLRPHLVRALRLHMGLRRQAQSHFAGQALLDVLPQGTLMIDETRLIQYRNPVARNLLDSGGPLRERAGFLDCIRPSGRSGRCRCSATPRSRS